MQKNTIKSSLLKSGENSKGKRSLRVAAEIKRDLPDLIRAHVILPGNLIVSITDVTVSSDLAMAKIYFSILGKDEEQQSLKVSKLLNAKRGAIRSELSKMLIMRQHPDLKFIYDVTPAKGARIEQLFKQIHENEIQEKKDKSL